MSECKLYGKNRPDMYLFTHEQLVSMVNEAYSYGEQGIDTADFRIKCEDFGPNFVQERTCEIVGFTSAVRDSRGLIEYPPVWNLSCGHEAAWWKPLSCPNCGSKVIGDE